MIKGDQKVFDGQTSWAGGMALDLRAELIDADQYVDARNVVCRDGVLSARPGFVHQPLSFASRSIERDFVSGRYQGAAVYVRDTFEAMVVQIDGWVYWVNLKTWEVDRINQVGRNATHAERVGMTQAGPFLLVNDGLGIQQVIVFDSSTPRRASDQENPLYDSEEDPDWIARVAEVPANVTMSFGHDRLFWARGNLWGACDLRLINNDESLLRMVEDGLLSLGGSFMLPERFGSIVALTFVPGLDTAEGKDILLIMAERGIMGCMVEADRAEWQPFVILDGVGPVGPMAVAAVNSDVWFVSNDGGLRSVRLARQEFERWINYPMSVEVDALFNANTDWLTSYQSMAFWGRRVLVTMSPWRWWVGTTLFKGDRYPDAHCWSVLSLDLSPVGRLRGEKPPAFDSVWDGVFPVQLFDARVRLGHRAFCFSRDPVGVLRLYEIKEREPDSYFGIPQPMRKGVVTRDYAFESIFATKRGITGEIFFDQVEGVVQVSVSYRANQGQAWLPWRTKTLVADAESGPEREDGAIALPSGCGAVRLGSPPDGPLNALSVQLRIEWTGNANLVRIRLIGNHVAESIEAGCAEEVNLPQERVKSRNTWSRYSVAHGEYEL